LYNLSRILSKSDPPEAQHYEVRSEALRHERQIEDRAELLNNSALGSAEAHDWSEAVTQLKEALDICGQCPQLSVLHKNLGLIYARKGSVEDAQRELRLALKLHPDEPDALKALEILRNVRQGSSTLK